MREKYKYIVGLLLYTTQLFFAQTHHFKNYNTEQGLPQSQVLSLFQDSKGYIWVGTNSGGIGKFDGNKFETVNKNDGLIDDVVFSVSEDDKGRMLIGTSKGLSVYFKQSFRNYNEKNGLDNSWIYHLEKDGESFWIGTQQGAFEFKKDSIFTFKSDSILNNSSIYTIHNDNKGNILFGTMQNGLIVYHKKNGKFTHVNTTNGLLNNFIFSIATNNKGEYLIGTATGLNILSSSFSLQPFEGIVTNENIGYSTILEHTDNTFFFGSFSEGLLKLDFNKKNSALFFNKDNGLTNNPIISSLKDREGNIWIGTDGSGLYKYFNDKFIYYTKNNGLAENYINAVAEDAKGNLWVAPSLNGVAKISGNNIVSYNEEFFKKNKLPDKNINAILALKNGRVLFGTDQGLCYFENEKFVTFTDALIRTKLINTLYQDDNGDIYIGTNSGVLVYRNNMFFEIEALREHFREGMLDVFSVVKDINNKLIFGTENGIIEYYNGQAKVYNSGNRFINGRVTNAKIDSRKNIWLGTSDGLYFYKNGIFTRISKKDGFTSGFINFLNIDANNNLFIGSNNGIDILNLNDFYANKPKFKHLSKDDGLLSLESNANASFITKEGKLIVGTIKGVEIYNPNLDLPNRNEPITSITDVKLFYGQENINNYSSETIDGTLLPNNLNLPYNKNNLTFKFIGISLMAPEKVMYQYKLEGLDADWTPSVSKTEVTYPSIPPGSYTFMVKAMNNDGLWNSQPSYFEFIISPPWYKTWWFYSIVVIGVISGFFGYNYVRTKKLIADKQKLENVVNERTKELREEKEKVEVINKEVVQQKAEIENKNIEITDSIKYAKNIQEALLPSLPEVEKTLGNSFILYLPKDIVSGDFYWHSYHNNIHYIAAADCTGHGVPGAFMSIVGNNLLNEIINRKNISEPGMILSELHQGVKIALNQHKQESERRDGMDIALCAIDTKKKVINYSGANRPFWLIRKEDQKHIEIIKASKFPIGGLELEAERIYKNHEITYKPGDTFYIFSDGFADQFGGPKGKKFMVANMQKLLMNNVSLDMPQQKANILASFNAWKNNLEQIDDVLVIGVRL
ncbi:MAG: two-component regulator propeller domain-containing protein [Bacteroidia bacterium]